MPCGSRSEYRPRPGVLCNGLRGAVVLRHRAAKHCPAAALRPASVTRLLSAVFGRRGCVAWTVCRGALFGLAAGGFVLGECCRDGLPGLRGMDCQPRGALSWVAAGAACRAMGLSVGAAGRAVPEEGCVRSPVRPAIPPPKRMLCANKAFSRSPAKGGRAFCVRPVPMPRSRGCRALRRVRRCGAVRRVRPFRAWGRGCRGRASRP